MATSDLCPRVLCYDSWDHPFQKRKVYLGLRGFLGGGDVQDMVVGIVSSASVLMQQIMVGIWDGGSRIILQQEPGRGKGRGGKENKKLESVNIPLHRHIPNDVRPSQAVLLSVLTGAFNRGAFGRLTTTHAFWNFLRKTTWFCLTVSFSKRTEIQTS